MLNLFGCFSVMWHMRMDGDIPHEEAKKHESGDDVLQVYLLMSGHTSGTDQTKRVVRTKTAVPAVMNKLMHALELLMVCWLQALLFLVEQKQHQIFFIIIGRKNLNYCYNTGAPKKTNIWKYINYLRGMEALHTRSKKYTNDEAHREENGFWLDQVFPTVPWPCTPSSFRQMNI